MNAIKTIVGAAVSTPFFGDLTDRLKNRPDWRGLVAVALLLAAGAARAALPIEHWRQPSGAQVWHVQSMALPMLDVQIDFDGGNRRDPATQAGLAAATATMTGKGLLALPGVEGAPARDENQLSQDWAALGASLSVNTSNDRMSFRLRSLTEPGLLRQVTALAAQQLAAPAFDAGVWQRERARWQARLQESRTRPGTVASEAFEQAVYGSHPYGYQVSGATLAAIDPDAMRMFYRQSVRPCAARVSVVGALTRAAADALVASLLRHLPASTSTSASACAPLPPLPEVQPLAAARDIELPFDAAQAQVLIGQPGYKRSDPQFFALLVGNYILGGGGFASRLTEQVRERRGLSYSVGSAFAPGRHAGAFTIGLQTRPDQAAQAVAVAQQVLRQFVQQGPDEAELKAAKDFLTGSFALRLDSNRKLLDQVANIAWNDLPLDYLDTWTQRIGAVTVEDIRQALQRVLQPECMVTLVLGARASQAPVAPASQARP